MVNSFSSSAWVVLRSNTVVPRCEKKKYRNTTNSQPERGVAPVRNNTISYSRRKRSTVDISLGAATVSVALHSHDSDAEVARLCANVPHSELTLGGHESRTSKEAEDSVDALLVVEYVAGNGFYSYKQIVSGACNTVDSCYKAAGYCDSVAHESAEEKA